VLTDLHRCYRRLRRSGPIARVGTPRRLLPISREFGSDRGHPIDRYDIEDFLRRHIGAYEYTPGAIYGHVLEVGDDIYSRKFGLRVDRIDVLDVSPESPRSTIVADLTNGSNLPSDAYDCVLCIQTVLMIYDVRASIRTIHRILKPGGTALVTAPGISQVCRPEIDSWGDY
jgi:hypothetical protein